MWPWCEQPRVDEPYCWEVTHKLSRPFFSFLITFSLDFREEHRVIFSAYCAIIREHIVLRYPSYLESQKNLVVISAAGNAIFAFSCFVDPTNCLVIEKRACIHVPFIVAIDTLLENIVSLYRGVHRTHIIFSNVVSTLSSLIFSIPNSSPKYLY